MCDAPSFCHKAVLGCEDGKETAERLDGRGERAVFGKQNNTNEATMLLKTQVGKHEFRNEAKKYLKTKELLDNPECRAKK